MSITLILIALVCLVVLLLWRHLDNKLIQKNIENLGWKYGGQHWLYKNDYYYYIVVYDERFGEMNIYMHIHSNETSNMDVTILNGREESYSLEDDSYLFNGTINSIRQLKLIMELTMER